MITRLFKEDLQLEFNRSDILKSVDKDFVHHLQYYNDLRSKIGTTNLIDSKDWYLQSTKGSELHFNIRSAKNNNMYVNIVSFVDPYKWLEENFKLENYDLNVDKSIEKLVKDLKYYFRNAIDTDDIQLYCSCPNFKYRYQYINSQLDTVIRTKPEDRPAKIRNPKELGLICKHLNYTLKMISDNKNKSQISEYLVDDFLTTHIKNKNIKTKFWRGYFTFIIKRIG
jgi:hypothetical protein